MTNLSHQTLGKLSLLCAAGFLLCLVRFSWPVAPERPAPESVGSDSVWFVVYPPQTKVYRVSTTGNSSREFVGSTNAAIPRERVLKGEQTFHLIFENEGFATRVLEVVPSTKLDPAKLKGVWPAGREVVSLEPESLLASLRVRKDLRLDGLLGMLAFLLGGGVIAWQRKARAARADALEKLEASATAQYPYLGAKIKEFRLVEPLGEGGMGSVYLGVPDQLFGTPQARQKAVAVKFCINLDPQNVERFYQELDVAKTLDHPNVLKVYEKGMLERPGGSVPYLIMEYLDGQTLHDHITSKDENGDEIYRTFEPKTVIELVQPIVDGLQHAHEHNVVHRDLKPSNIMMCEDGTVRILDFGLSKILGNRSLTLSGQIMGTPMYMSKEQITGGVDTRTDQFALGCLIYRMLTGGHPYGDEWMSIVQNLTTDRDPRPLEESSPEVAAVVEKMVAIRPEDRFPSVKEAFAEFVKAARS